jgi:hypothetical protein
MANPQERPSAQASVVAACTVTNCVHNRNEECHAGQIEVRVGAQGAVCGTYRPEGAERPRP